MAVIGSPAIFGLLYSLRRELLQFCFLLGTGGRIDARVVRSSELPGQLTVVFPRVLAGTGGNLGRQQSP